MAASGAPCSSPVALGRAPVAVTTDAECAQGVQHDEPDDEADEGGDEGVEQPPDEAAQRPADRVVDVLLPVVEEVVRRVQGVADGGALEQAVVTADLVEADQEDVATDPEHGERADEGDAGEQLRHEADHPETDPLGGPGVAPGQGEADVVHLHDQRDDAVDEDGDQHRDDGQHDRAHPDARVGVGADDLLERDHHDLGAEDEVGAHGVGDGALLVLGGELPRLRHLLLGLGGVPGEALVHLVGALVGEEATTEDQDHRQQPREELPEQHRCGEDEEQLVAQRADGDLLDDRQLAVRSGPVEVLRGHGGVVDHDAGGLGAGPTRGSADVVHAGCCDARERGDVVEEGEQSAGHGRSFGQVGRVVHPVGCSLSARRTPSCPADCLRRRAGLRPPRWCRFRTKQGRRRRSAARRAAASGRGCARRSRPTRASPRRRAHGGWPRSNGATVA